MKSISKILVPVDFSPRCEGAVRYAHVVAGRSRADLTLLHVAPSVQFDFAAVQPAPETLLSRTEAQEADRCKALENFMADSQNGFHVNRIVVSGDPAEQIVRYAHAESMDLIVMPTHGYSPLRRFLIGSVTAKVLHDSEIPVWTGVHLGEPAMRDFALRHVLCAIDLGPQSQRVLEWACRVAAEFGTSLTITHATPELGESVADFARPEWRVSLVNRVRQTIMELQEKAGTNAVIEVQNGEPHKVVSAVAKRLDSDLVVIGRGSTSGMFGRLRANSYAIIRESPCPVVSV
jgi:nucleotide-binding universal stress UspA family protein